MRSPVRTIALLGLAATQLGFVPPNFARRARGRAARATIVNSGDMYDLINTTDCLPWPSEEAKAVGGQSGWKDWRPVNGDQGTPVARAKHCFLERTVVFLKMGELFLAIGAEGIRFDSGALEELPLLSK